MALIRGTLNGVEDIVKVAIEAIKEHEGRKPYWVGNSGGKDSGAIMRLMEMAEVDYEAHHNFTTVDPPELIRHLRDNYPDTIIDRPKRPMLGPEGLIVRKGFPPTRRIRYCCGLLKEKGGRDHLVVTGKRREESPARSIITLIEPSRNDKRVTFFNPILNWTSKDVWEFTVREKIPYCCLYRQGFCRLGCIMCPLVGGKQMAFEAGFFPKYYVAYLRTFAIMIKERADMAEKYGFKSPLDVMHWWMWKSHLKEDRTTQMILQEE
jgi:phosphoadenosine phosphosulfate reductase